MVAVQALRFADLAVIGLVLAACTPERPPRPEDGTAPPSALQLQPGVTQAVYSYGGEGGRFIDVAKPEDVPAKARGFVRVTLLEGPEPPPGQVFVANLQGLVEGKRAADIPLQVLARDTFEELALGQGQSSKVKLPDDLGGLLAPPDPGTLGKVIVYKTAWCGVCKTVESYLGKKRVPFVAKDIEADPQAAAELQQKAKAKGLPLGSVPVIDVRGELVVGFDRNRLEQLL